MQAYSFTNRAIGSALVEAQKRGVKLRVILDFEAAGQNPRQPEYIAKNDVPTWTDHEHSISHNKIIIADNATVITGSFNFTEQAENYNAENLVILTEKPKIAAGYEANFESHLKHSKVYKVEEK